MQETNGHVFVQVSQLSREITALLLIQAGFEAVGDDIDGLRYGQAACLDLLLFHGRTREQNGIACAFEQQEDEPVWIGCLYRGFQADLRVSLSATLSKTKHE